MLAEQVKMREAELSRKRKMATVATLAASAAGDTERRKSDARPANSPSVGVV